MDVQRVWRKPQLCCDTLTHFLSAGSTIDSSSLRQLYLLYSIRRLCFYQNTDPTISEAFLIKATEKFLAPMRKRFASPKPNHECYHCLSLSVSRRLRQVCPISFYFCRPWHYVIPFSSRRGPRRVSMFTQVLLATDEPAHCRLRQAKLLYMALLPAYIFFERSAVLAWWKANFWFLVKMNLTNNDALGNTRASMYRDEPPHCKHT